MTAEEIREAIANKPLMNVTIYVYGHYTVENRTPLLSKETIQVPNGDYHMARQEAYARLKAYNGKDASINCDGWNQNYNIQYL